MLYLIGGAPRSGKSIIAHKLLELKEIPYFRTDYLVESYSKGTKELNINHQTPNKADVFWPKLEPILEDIVYEEDQYLVEGDIILPHLVKKFISDTSESKKTKSCFLGYSSITPGEKLKQIRNYGGSRNDWLQHTPDDKILDFLRQAIDLSKEIEKECSKNGMKYFDTSIGFSPKIEEAIKFLIG